MRVEKKKTEFLERVEQTLQFPWSAQSDIGEKLFVWNQRRTLKSTITFHLLNEPLLFAVLNNFVRNAKDMKYASRSIREKEKERVDKFNKFTALTIHCTAIARLLLNVPFNQHAPIAIVSSDCLVNFN